MPPLTQILVAHTIPSPLPTLYLSKKPFFSPPHRIPSLRLSSRPSSSYPRLPRCSLASVSTETPTKAEEIPRAKPSHAEVSRTIMELSSTGTLSSLSVDGWPLAIGARFVVDVQGAPAVCLNQPERLFAADARSSFHVQVQVWIFVVFEFLNHSLVWFFFFALSIMTRTLVTSVFKF